MLRYATLMQGGGGDCLHASAFSCVRIYVYRHHVQVVDTLSINSLLGESGVAAVGRIADGDKNDQVNGNNDDGADDADGFISSNVWNV